jgi:hypothetical protein
MFRSVVLLAFALASLFSPSRSSVADCGAGKSVFTILDQSFSPEPPVANQLYDYWFVYQVPEGVEVNEGTAKYSLSLNGIPFTPSTEDLCSQTSCPKVAGIHNETSTDTWPSGVSGKVVTKLEWFDASGNLLLCSQTTERI